MLKRPLSFGDDFKTENPMLQKQIVLNHENKQHYIAWRKGRLQKLLPGKDLKKGDICNIAWWYCHICLACIENLHHASIREHVLSGRHARSVRFLLARPSYIRQVPVVVRNGKPINKKEKAWMEYPNILKIDPLLKFRFETVCDFRNGETCLTLGEKDFSLAIAVARHLRGENVIGSSVDSRVSCIADMNNPSKSKFPSKNLTAALDLGVCCLWQVDASDLQGTLFNRKQILSLGPFNHLIYPLVNISTNSDANCSMMLKKFFLSAVKPTILVPHGLIQLILLADQIREWDVVHLADESGLVLHSVGIFNFDYLCWKPQYFEEKITDSNALGKNILMVSLKLKLPVVKVKKQQQQKTIIWEQPTNIVSQKKADLPRITTKRQKLIPVVKYKLPPRAKSNKSKLHSKECSQKKYRKLSQSSKSSVYSKPVTKSRIKEPKNGSPLLANFSRCSFQSPLGQYYPRVDKTLACNQKQSVTPSPPSSQEFVQPKKLKASGLSPLWVVIPTCPICSVELLSRREWDDHFLSQKHRTSYEALLRKGKTLRLSCTICKKEMDGQVEWEEHIGCKDHEREVAGYFGEPAENRPKARIMKCGGKRLCTICRSEITSYEQWNTHLLGKRHKAMTELRLRGMARNEEEVRNPSSVVLSSKVANLKARWIRDCASDVRGAEDFNLTKSIEQQQPVTSYL